MQMRGAAASGGLEHVWVVLDQVTHTLVNGQLGLRVTTL